MKRKQAIAKGWLRRRLPPPLYKSVSLVYNQRPFARRERRGWRERAELGALLFERCDGTIRNGPFAGMRFVSPTADTPAKFLGTYELELHAVIEHLAATKFDRVINIGCAEGYYAVGFARRMPGTPVDAYDIEPVEQELCRATAVVNGVENQVRVAGKCTCDVLNQTAAGSLVLMDCEGCEDHLLDPVAVPSLRRSTILVELHDWDDESLPNRVLSRFCESHTVEVIWSELRSEADSVTPELEGLTPEQRRLALFERPTSQRWAVMTPS